MPTIIVTHAVTDTDHWLSSPKREEILPSLGASSIRTFVNTQDRTKVGLVMDIADLDVLFVALENPPDGLAEAMSYDTVLPETMAILISSRNAGSHLQGPARRRWLATSSPPR